MATVGGTGIPGPSIIVIGGGSQAQQPAMPQQQQAAPTPPYIPPIPLAQALELSAPILTPPSYMPDLFPMFFEAAGGMRDSLSPMLTSLANTADPYGAKVLHFGRMKHKPKLVGDVLTALDGNFDQLIALLHLGIGNVQISDIKVGDRPISEIEEIEYNIVDDPADLKWYTLDDQTADVYQELTIDEPFSQLCPQPGNQFDLIVEMPDGINGAFVIDIEFRDPNAGVGEDYHNWTLIESWTLTDEFASSVPYFYHSFFDPAHEDVVKLFEVRLTQTGGPRCIWNILRVTKPGDVARQIRDIRGNIVPQKWMEIKGTASEDLQGNIDQISCIAERTVWRFNGTVWVEDGDSGDPAWAIADMLTGDGSNSEILRDDLDGQSFLDFSNWCADNGFTYNDTLDVESTISECIRTVMALCRCTIIDQGDKIAVAIDRQRSEVVQIFTPVNSWGFGGEVTCPKVPDYYRVRYLNEEADWKQDEVRCYQDGKDDTNSNTFQDLDARGSTSHDQSWKFGRIKLAEGLLRQQKMYLYSCLDWIVCDPGDLVLVNQDTAIKAGGGSGRILQLITNGSGDVTGIVVDYACAMAAGTKYGVRIRTVDGGYIHKVVNTVAGFQTTLTLLLPVLHTDDPFPAVGDLFIFGELNREGVEMLVEEIEPQGDEEARLTLIEHGAGIMQAITGNIPDPPDAVTITPIQEEVVPPPVIHSIKSDESVLVRMQDGSLPSRIMITVNPQPSTVRYYQAQYRSVGSLTWTTLPAVPAQPGMINTIIIMPVTDLVTYEIQIKALNNRSRGSVYTAATHQVIGQSTPPPDVASLDPAGETLYITPVSIPIDFAGYKIVWNFQYNTNREVAQIASALHTTSQFDMSSLPKNTISVGVAMVDLNGNESVNMKWFVRNAGDPLVGNLYYTQSEAPTWDGTIEGGSIDGSGYLVADSDAVSLWGADNNAPLWNSDPLTPLWSGNFAKLVYTKRFKPPTDIFEDYQLTLDLDVEGEGILVEYRRFGKNPLWDIAPGGDQRRLWNKADTDSLWDPPDVFVPWPGSIPGRQEEIEVRITCQASSRYQGIIRQFDWRIALPTITERVSNFLVDDPAGKRLTLTNRFRTIFGVGDCTVNADPAYPTAYVCLPQDKLSDGPLVKVFDTTGNGTTGIIDCVVEGYGSL